MTFLLVIVASFILAFFLRNRLEWAVVAVIAARYFIPSSASVEFVPFLDPAIYLLAAIYLVLFVGNFSRFIEILQISRVEVFGLAALTLLALMNVLGQGFALQNVASELIRNYLAAILLYLLIRAICVEGYRSGRNKALVIVYSYLVFSVAQSIMAIIQEQQNALIVWEAAFRRTWAGEDGGFGRSQGFLESGLGLGTSMVAAIVLCAWVRFTILKFSLALLFLYTMMLSSSRAALFVGIVLVIVITFLSAGGSKLMNLLALGGSTAAVLTFIGSGGADGLLGKIADDNESTAKRLEAYAWFWENAQSFLVTGYQGNRDFRASGTLSSSLENAFFMASANFSALFGLLLLGMLLFIAFRSFSYGKMAIVAGIGLVGFIAVENTNSGFAAMSFSGYALWILAGLCSFRFADKTTASTEKKELDLASNPAKQAVGLQAANREAPYRRYLQRS